jgi:nucleoside 2-deoxyribosyltransferase
MLLYNILLSRQILISKMEKENKMTITKDLQAISKELMKLVKQIENLTAAFGQAEKPKAKSVKTTTKAKTVTKKAPVKAAKITDTDKVLAIVNRFKKGVDTATLMKKTGFNQKKVRNILFRTYKQGKITRAEKGIYVGVK